MLSVLDVCVLLDAQQGNLASIQKKTPYSFTAHLANSLVGYVTYLLEMIYPAGLASPYPDHTGQQPLWKVACSLLVLLAISALAWRARRRRPYFIVGWLWYGVMMLPVIGILPGGVNPGADRYMYLPQVGLWVAIAWGAADLARGWSYGRWLTAAAAVPLLTGWTLCAHQQASYWRDSETLWTRAIACGADGAVVQHNLGNDLAVRGQYDEAVAHYRREIEFDPRSSGAHNSLAAVLMQQGKFDEAVANSRISVDLDPDNSVNRSNLAFALFRQGNIDEAIEQYQQVLKHDPHFARAYNDLGTMLVRQDKADQAVEYFQQAIDNDPYYADAHFNLAVVAMREERYADAVAHAQTALAIEPRHAAAHATLAMALSKEGHVDQAVEHLKQALEIEPDKFDSRFQLGVMLCRQGQDREALSNLRAVQRQQPNRPDVLRELAWLLATSPDDSVRNASESLQFAQRLAQQSDFLDPALLDLLAAAYAEAGEFSRRRATGRTGAQRRHAAAKLIGWRDPAAVTALSLRSALSRTSRLSLIPSRPLSRCAF